MPIARTSGRAGTARGQLASLCVWAYAAPTSERAKRLFLPYADWRLDRDRTRHRPFPGPTELASGTLSATEKERVEQLRRTTIHGSAEVMAARLRRLAQEFAVDEIVIVTMTHDPADRLLSYRLIAAEMGLADPVNMRRQLPLAESVS